MEIKTIQTYAKNLSARNDWDKQPLETRLAYLKCELGEVLQEVQKFQATTNVTEQEAIKIKLGHELFDLIWNAAELANRFDIDLESASLEKMKINTNRTFSSSPKEVN